jgi:hypothetical protein
VTANRKQPSAGFWITVALVAVLVGYPLSVGPAFWIKSRLPWELEFAHDAFLIFYSPLYAVANRSQTVARGMAWWMCLFSADPALDRLRMGI